MQRLTIARFDAVRTANIVAALYAVIVLVIGLLFAVPILLVALAAGRDMSPGVATGGAVGGLVLLALAVVFYAGIGWVMTALVCILYNALAARIGGIRVEVQAEGPAMMGPGGPGWATPAPISAAPAGPQPPRSRPGPGLRRRRSPAARRSLHPGRGSG